jgi:hypothetical protein
VPIYPGQCFTASTSESSMTFEMWVKRSRPCEGISRLPDFTVRTICLRFFCCSLRYDVSARETSAPISCVQADSISNHSVVVLEGVRAIWSSRERGIDAKPRCIERLEFDRDLRLIGERAFSGGGVRDTRRATWIYRSPFQSRRSRSRTDNDFKSCLAAVMMLRISR